MTSIKITPSCRFGFRTSILYWPHQGLNLFSALTLLLDRTGAKPYSPAPQVSTQIRRLLSRDYQGLGRPARDGVEYPAHPAFSMANRTPKPGLQEEPEERHG